MWEDPVNELGGKWVIQFPRNKTGEDINTLWLYTVSNFYIFLIFELFKFRDHFLINGLDA